MRLIMEFSLPMPPSPILAVTAYEPRVVPGCSNIVSRQDPDSDQATAGLPR